MSKRAIRFGRAQHLIGIVHEVPGDQPRLPTAALLWNTGVSHRSGPHRVNVELAEAMAREGLTVLHFDLARLGDSDESDEKIDVQDSNTRDLADAVQFLVREYEIEDFILIGLCSSAVDAFYFARTDARVKGLFMVDTFVYPTLTHKLISNWRRFSSLARWKRWVRRQLTRSLLPARDSFEPNYPHPLEARDGLRSMLRAGMQIVVIYTGGFTPYFSYKGQFPAMLKAGEFDRGLRLLHWPKTDHLFTMLEDRHLLKETLFAWLKEFFIEDLVRTPEILPNMEMSEEPRPEVLDQAPATEGLDETLLLAPVLTVFRELLAPVVPDADDSFFDLGGTSILAIRAAALLSERMQRDISVVTIYAEQTARALAVVLAKDDSTAALVSPVRLGSHAQHNANANAQHKANAQHDTHVQKLPHAQQNHALRHDTPVQSRMPEPDSSDLRRRAEHTNEKVPSRAYDPMQGDGIAIIGIACKTPGAKDWRELWDLLERGESGMTRFARDELDSSLPHAMRNHPNYVPVRGIIDGDCFDAAFFGMSRREASFTDPQQRVLLQTCWQALEDSGYSRARKELKVAVYAGVGSNTYLARNIMQGHATPHSEEEFLASMANDKDFVATRIAYALDLKGPAVSIHTACSTSLVAVIEAAKAILVGDADIALAGAASVTAPIASGHLYQEGGIFSKDGNCRPFAEAANGTIFSDGSAVVVLKRMSQAQRDGDHIYAQIKAWGLNNDGHEKSSFAAPSVKGQAAAIRQALDRAQWDPSSIAYVECHGTATPIGDPIEIEGLRRGFALPPGSPLRCALGSIKGNIGHLTAAAGTISLIKTALVLQKNRILAARGAYPLNPALDRVSFYVPQSAIPWTQTGPRRAGVSCFGVGGTNAHLLLEEVPASPQPPASSDDPWMVLSWSARDAETCRRFGLSLGTFLPNDRAAIQALGSTLLRDRESFAWRQSAVGFDRSSLHASLAAATEPQEASAGVCWLFPGQGSQYQRMGLGLAARWPRFSHHYQKVISLFETLCQLPLAKVLSERAGPDRLQETLFTQPALFSLEWALATSFLEAGLTPQCLVGHSIGELAAACIAGVFTLEDGVRIVSARAAAMQSAPPGAMLAVRSDWNSLAAQLPPSISLAARNGPKAIVIAGPLDAIEAAAATLKTLSLASRRLDTSHAFHSPLMDPILESYAAVFEQVDLRAPQLPLYSSVSGRLLTAVEAQSPRYWVEQIRQPVNFAAAIETLADASLSFFEIGPKAALSRLVPTIKKKAPVIASLSEATEESEVTSLMAAIAQLWNQGHPLFAPPAMPRVSAPAYPFSGEKLWLDPKPPLAAPASLVLAHPFLPSIDPLAERLVQLLADLSGLAAEALEESREWTQLGLDSLLLTQWALKLQKEFGVDLSLQQLQGPLPHLGALRRYLAPLVPQLSEARAEPLVQTEGLGSRSLEHILEKQNQLIERQLALFEQFMGRSGVPEAKHLPFWQSLPIDGTCELFTDQGVIRLPRYRGSFLVRDPQGQPALYIEDPEHKGQFWHITAEA